ncbi:hypothetical protein HHL22_03255 [Hymenobacter sp. RP-2-7]|uniref:Transcriptional repressor n=1 Tax=Hymenobacter polaris TaxID=2682546 RepID=A0A7Y0FL68_9BACT|nr:hypothetical protein [Hymenobacter polaris]NML64215.1 hypothetical protein [Hymenobacter polaris]
MLTAEFIAQTLRAHALRLTPSRRAVLEVLVAAPFALSGTEVEQQAPTSLDRATLFRTLRLLEQKHLIHRVVDYTETVRFAAAPALRAASPPLGPPTEHVHLKCLVCQHLYCLPHVPVPAVPEAGGYHVTRRDCLLSGICERCQPGSAAS